jgi:hypothetical protein
MNESPLELSLIVEIQDDRSIDDLSKPFYDRFDGLISSRMGRTYVLMREDGQDGPSTAVASVIELESTLGVRVLAVDWDLVDMAEIAERMDVTRANVHQLVTGQRASGGFPAPLGSPSGHRVWAWGSVNEWIRSHRPTAWSGTRSLSEDQMRQLDGWLVDRRQALEPQVHASGTWNVASSTLVSRFLRGNPSSFGAAGRTSANRAILVKMS